MTLSYSNHTRIILAIAGIVGVALALVLLVVLPLLKNLQETNAAIVRNEQEIARIETEILSYETLSVKFVQASGEREALARMFPVREEMVGLVEGLETALGGAGLFSSLLIYDKDSGQNSGAGGAKVLPKSVVPGLRRIAEVPYVLQLAANNYRQFVDFLLYLENLPVFNEISKLSLVADSLQGEGGSTLRNTGTATGKLEAVFFIQEP